jgi:hypothetical protein
MRLFRTCAALAVLLVACAPAFADVALPKEARADGLGGVRRDLPYSRMTIERVDGMREARLQIPRSQLSRINVAAGLFEQGGPAGASFGNLGTVVGGLFLSLALVLTGLLLARRRGLRVGRVAAALMGCACAAALAAVAAYANAAPPPGSIPQDPGTLIKVAGGGPLSGSIRVEVVEEGTEIKLLVPRKAQKGWEEEE